MNTLGRRNVGYSIADTSGSAGGRRQIRALSWKSASAPSGAEGADVTLNQ
jgi:hypothetical protein